MTAPAADDRAAIPLRIENGRVITEAIEINAAWHCNISCQWCSHASPIAPRRFVDPVTMGAELTSLSRWMTVDHLRILGGEPLLHPQLADVLRAARGSKIGTRLRVLTNGLTLHRTELSFWEMVDEIHISAYPSTAKAVQRRLKRIRDAAASSGTTVTLKQFDRFRVSYREPSGDRRLTRRIYGTCQVANLWRCITLEDGRLFRCPQAAHVHMADEYSGHRGSHGEDFLEVSRIGSAREVLAWLRRPDALASCDVCTGSAGSLQVHQQMNRKQPTDPVPAVDRTYLALLELDGTASNGCLTGETVVWGAG